jgi:hypothetical protein
VLGEKKCEWKLKRVENGGSEVKRIERGKKEEKSEKRGAG